MLAKEKGKRISEEVADYVVFDLETTGISSAKDEVIEISALKVRNGVVVGEFSTLVNPGRSIPFQASQVNGITDAMVKDAPTFEVALKDFLEFIGDDVLVGHNINSFDMKFIYRDVEKFWGKTINNDYLDTLLYSRQKLLQLKNHKLVDLAEYYHISSEGAHRALNDCHMNQKVFEHLKKEKRGKVTGTDMCPNCGLPLKKRSGKYGEFWGCTGFPMCRYTKNV